MSEKALGVFFQALPQRGVPSLCRNCVHVQYAGSAKCQRDASYPDLFRPACSTIRDSAFAIRRTRITGFNDLYAHIRRVR